MLVDQNIYNNNYYYKPASNKPVAFKATTKTNNTTDTKFTAYDATKSFIKGLISPVTTIFKNVKNFVIGMAFLAGITAAMAATGGALIPVFAVLGIGLGSYDIAKGAVGLAHAKGNKDKEKAFYNLGSGTGGLGLSLVGAKSLGNPVNIAKNIKNCEFSAKNFLALIKNPFLAEYDEAIESTVVKSNLVENVHYGEIGHDSFSMSGKIDNNSDDKRKKKLNKTFAPFLVGGTASLS